MASTRHFTTRCAGFVFPCDGAAVRYLFVTIGHRYVIAGYCRSCWRGWIYNYTKGQTRGAGRPIGYRAGAGRQLPRRLAVSGVR